MFNKNDPLIGAVQQVMQKNQAEREAAKAVNEKFGVADRKALPHEKQSAWDAAYKKVLTEGVESIAESDDELWSEKGDKKIKPAKAKSYKHKTSGKEINSTKHPGSEWKKVEEELSPAQKTHMDVNKNGKIDSHDLKLKRAGLEEAKDSLAAFERRLAGKGPKRKGEWDKQMKKQTKYTMKMLTPAAKAARDAAAAKEIDEGFNNRHSLSVNASAEKQAVAELNEAGGSPAVAAWQKKKNPQQGELLGNIVKGVLPGADAAEKIGKGDYKGAIKSGAIDAALTAAGGPILRTAGKAIARGYRYLRGGAKAADAAVDAARATTKALPAPAKAKVSPAARESGGVARGKPDPAPSTAPQTAGKTPVKPTGSAAFSGNMQGRLNAVRRNAGSDLKARQLPALRKTTEPAIAKRPGVPATIPPRNTAVARPGAGPNLAAGGKTRIVGLSPKGKAVVGGAAGAAAVGGAMLARKNATPPAATAKSAAKPIQDRVPDSTLTQQPKVSQTTSTTAGKVTDRDIMNDKRYKQAVKTVGGNDAARRIKAGTDVNPVGTINKGSSIWDNVKKKLEAERSTTKTSTEVTGGQGIAGIASSSTNKPVNNPNTANMQRGAEADKVGEPRSTTPAPTPVQKPMNRGMK